LAIKDFGETPKFLKTTVKEDEDVTYVDTTIDGNDHGNEMVSKPNLQATRK
jgi:hypothetical protein